jgi:predicted transposase YdaD
MAKPFDVTLKHLMDKYPKDWLGLLGIDPEGPVKSIDADVSTVSLSADKVYRIANKWLLHWEMQSSYMGLLPDRLHLGNTVLHHRHKLPVQSVAVLLRPEADGRAMTGVLHKRHPTGRQYLEFHYDVVRVWQLPLESILVGGLGILPLAPLVDASQPQLPAVVKKMKRRLENEATPDEDASIWTATYVLMGLRYSRQFAAELLRGVRTMKDSVTYQAIVEEGLAEGRAEGRAEGLKAMREVLFEMGTKRFGKPDRKTAKLIDSIDELGQLKRLTERILDADDWKDLLRE